MAHPPAPMLDDEPAVADSVDPLAADLGDTLDDVPLGVPLDEPTAAVPLGAWAPSRPRPVPPGMVEVHWLTDDGWPTVAVLPEARASRLASRVRVVSARHPSGRVERPAHPAARRRSPLS